MTTYINSLKELRGMRIFNFVNFENLIYMKPTDLK